MEAKAQAKYVRCTPMKARRVINVVRGKNALEATNVLRFAPQAAAVPVRKVVESAIANARVKAQAAGETFREEELLILEAYADEGPTLKRFRPRAQGRASRILKRTSHITVVVGTKDDAKKEAVNILQKQGVTYGNVALDPHSDGGHVIEGLTAFPTTMVIDQNGRLVGDPITGGSSKLQGSELQKRVDQALAQSK